MVALYEFMRDQGARASFGTGSAPSVTMWLGERDDDRSNPVAVAINVRTIGIYFHFVRTRRRPAEMQR